MDKSIMTRIKILESKIPADLYIYALTKDGVVETVRAKDIISADGELNVKYAGIGCNNRLVVSGSSPEDVLRILTYVKLNAEREVEKIE